MKYAIAKVNKDTMSFLSFGGSYTPNVDINGDVLYGSVDSARDAIYELFQDKENQQSTKAWNDGSDEERADWGGKLEEDPEKCMTLSNYFIIPIAEKVEVKGKVIPSDTSE
jgi:hypothetical protein